MPFIRLIGKKGGLAMKKRLLVVTLLIGLLGGCETESLEVPAVGNPPVEEMEPPEVKITTTTASYQMRQGGYEWTIEGRRKGEKVTSIADVAAPNQSLQNGGFTLIGKTEGLALQFEVQPDRYEIYGWYADNTKIKVEELEELKGDTPVAIEVVGYYPQGHSSYVLPVIFE